MEHKEYPKNAEEEKGKKYEFNPEKCPNKGRAVTPSASCPICGTQILKINTLLIGGTLTFRHP